MSERNNYCRFPLFTYLPAQIFLLAVIDDGAFPAMTAADVDDVLLLFGRNQAIATPHLEILLTAPAGYERMADAALYSGGHVIVELGQPALHHHLLILAEHLAPFTANLRIGGVDTGANEWLCIDILVGYPMQTAFTDRALTDEARCIGGDLPAEGLFLLLRGRLTGY